MGGNVSVMSASGQEVQAQKIDLNKIGRSKFQAISNKLFKTLNTLMQSKTDRTIWPDESHLDKATVYNGSTSFIMSNEYTDDEILKVKPQAGDIDIAVPDTCKEDLYELLYALRGRKVTPGVVFIGMNRTSSGKLGTQINCVFEYLKEFLVQVDFEFLPFEEDGQPTEWARFSHSSSFADTSAGIKAVHHKYLIRAMIGALSVRDDIVIATPKSQWDKITLSKKDTVARMLKFSVDHGVRVAYRPMLDLDGSVVIQDGKEVWQEIPTKDSEYKKTVQEIFTLAFEDGEKEDAKELWTFTGLLKLIKKYLTPHQIQQTADRYFEMMWGDEGQKLERNDPETDAAVKGAGWDLFKKTLGVKDPSMFEERLTKYYMNY